MVIASDYPTPVNVNGFSCKNCTDLGYAKKHIDPEHPKSGPYGINAKDDPTIKNTSGAVLFGGSLSALNGKAATQSAAEGSGNTGAQTTPESAIGAQLDISV